KKNGRADIMNRLQQNMNLATLDSFHHLLVQNLAWHLIRNDIDRFVAIALNLVGSRFHCNNQATLVSGPIQKRYLKEILTVNVPLIHLHKVHIILAYIQFVAVNIVFGCKEDTNDRLDIFVAVDGDVIGKRFMIETIMTCLYQQRLSLLVAAYRYGVVEH
ncbi:hypothetical protein ALC56_13615, partial [Trachymyrmex septentrionalis]